MSTKLRLGLVTKTAQATIVKTPSDGSGTGQAIVAGWATDSDNERFDRQAFDGVRNPVPMGYQHVYNDPGAEIGSGVATPGPMGLLYDFKLDLTNPTAMGVYERMMLDPSDPLSLSQFSVGFSYQRRDTFTGPAGEKVIRKADLQEVSVVWKGAQQTELLAIKAAPLAPPQPTAAPTVDLRERQRAVLAAKGLAFMVDEPPSRWGAALDRQRDERERAALGAAIAERAEAMRAEAARKAAALDRFNRLNAGLGGRGFDDTPERPIVSAGMVLHSPRVDAREQEQRERYLAGVERRAAEQAQRRENIEAQAVAATAAMAARTTLPRAPRVRVTP